MGLQVALSGAFEFLLLSLADAHCSAAETGIAAQAHFNKYQRLAIAHNQIDFAVLAAKIPFNELESLGL